MKELIKLISTMCVCTVAILIFFAVMITAGFLITVVLESVFYGF